MKKQMWIVSCFLFYSFSAWAGDAVCKKCEIIREENKKKVNPYAYYEDYLKAEKKAPIENKKTMPEPHTSNNETTE